MRWVGIAWVEVEIVAIGFIKNIAKSRRCFRPTTAVMSGFTEYGITARMDKTATDEVKRS